MSKGGEVLLLICLLDAWITLYAINFAHGSELHPLLKFFEKVYQNDLGRNCWIISKFIINGLVIFGMEMSLRKNRFKIERGYRLVIFIYIFAFLFLTLVANFIA